MENIKVLVASDSFKGSATSLEVAEAIEKGILKVNPKIEIFKYSIADGGEGTLETIIDQNNGQYIEVEVMGPFKTKVKAKYGVVGTKVFIEMAQSSGLCLIEPKDKNPLLAHTYGVGQMINDALNRGYRDIYIGLGGSATNDAGMGMAKALGVRFLDDNLNEVGLGAIEFDKINSIDISNLNKKIKDTKFTILSDVTNPLCGKNGASKIFGPQKGADEKTVQELDNLLFGFGQKVENVYGKSFMNIDGSGAAGGLGFGILAFCNGQITSGIESVIDLIGIEDIMPEIDLVITGEGNMDNQSIKGKAPVGIAKLAKKYKKPVIAVVGGRSEFIDEIYNNGIDLIIDIAIKPMELEYAIGNAKKLIEIAGESSIRAYYIGK